MCIQHELRVNYFNWIEIVTPDQNTKNQQKYARKNSKESQDEREDERECKVFNEERERDKRERETNVVLPSCEQEDHHDTNETTQHDFNLGEIHRS